MEPMVPAKILLDHLDVEKDVLSKLLVAQKDVYCFVAARDWINLHGALELCNSYAAKFERLEQQRERLTGAGLNFFYEFSSKYEHDDKCALNESFRELKQLFTVSRAEHESLSAYLMHASALTNGFFNAVIPSRRNKIYSRSGAVVARDVENLVLNRAL